MYCIQCRLYIQWAISYIRPLRPRDLPWSRVGQREGERESNRGGYCAGGQYLPGASAVMSIGRRRRRKIQSHRAPSRPFKLKTQREREKGGERGLPIGGLSYITMGPVNYVHWTANISMPLAGLCQAAERNNTFLWLGRKRRRANERMPDLIGTSGTRGIRRPDRKGAGGKERDELLLEYWQASAPTNILGDPRERLLLPFLCLFSLPFKRGPSLIKLLSDRAGGGAQATQKPN